MATSARGTSSGPHRPRPAYGEGVAALRAAALALATEVGLRAVTLRGVAERAGVSHGLVRHHFGTRDGLVAATVAEAASRTMYLEINDDAPLSARIDRTHGALRVQYDTMLSDPGTKAIDDVYARYRAEVAQWLELHGRAPDHATVLLVVAALDGLALQRLSRGDEVDVDGAFAALDRLVSAAGRRAAGPDAPAPS